MAIAAVHIKNTRQKKTNRRKVICPKGVAKCRTVTHRPPGKTKLVD